VVTGLIAWVDRFSATGETPIAALVGQLRGINGGSTTGGGFADLFLRAGGAVRNLVIQGFSTDAVRVNGGSALTENNSIGTSADGLSAVPNGTVGLWLEAGGSLVRNTMIAGNLADGIHIETPAGPARGTAIVGNRVGVGADGFTPVPNGAPLVVRHGAGIFVGPGAVGTRVGGTTVAERNVISANGGDGILVQRAGAGTVIEGNYVGVGADGTTVRGNGESGVDVVGAAGMTVGGPGFGARNVVAGNGAAGVRVVWDSLAGVPAGPTAVAGNFIGVDAAGEAAGNAFDGVLVGDRAPTVVGGHRPGAGNVIAGNGADGVEVIGVNDRGTLVQGSRIGTDPAGLAARANAGAGVHVRFGAKAVVVGGLARGAGNRISGNADVGVRVEGRDVVGTAVRGNFIGTDATGGRALPNAAGGVAVADTVRTDVGGARAGNLISGNGGPGVAIDAAPDFASSVRVLGNFIGTDLTGVSPLPNAEDGVRVAGGRRAVIGSGAGNRIAFNTGDGVAVAGPADGTRIRNNSTVGNGGLGIRLAAGGNGGIGAPVLTAVARTADGVVVRGQLAGRPRSALALELFGNAAADPSGSGEGELPLGVVTVRTDAAGRFAVRFRTRVPAGFGLLSLTATDAAGNSSEFSNTVAA